MAAVSYDGAKEMRDLTVNDIHTYYVIAGSEPVLVHHNNQCDPWDELAGYRTREGMPAAGSPDDVTYSGATSVGWPRTSVWSKCPWEKR